VPVRLRDIFERLLVLFRRRRLEALGVRAAPGKPTQTIMQTVSAAIASSGLRSVVAPKISVWVVGQARA